MTFVDAMTPKDTEEVKPGLFIQKSGKNYRQISPAAWGGKINWKNLIVGPNFWKGFIWFLIIIFLAWSFQHDVAQYKDFYEEVRGNPIAYCVKVEEATQSLECTKRFEEQGLCVRVFPDQWEIAGLEVSDATNINSLSGNN